MENKFVYKDNVEVVAGFYKGQKGMVIEEGCLCYTISGQGISNKYLVKTPETSFWVNDNDLRKCEE